MRSAANDRTDAAADPGAAPAPPAATPAAPGPARAPAPAQARADRLIATLELEPHPEGGHFRELFRSPAAVQPADERTGRSAITTIYFLLRAGERSRLHRVASDEVWHFYEGDPLELFWTDADITRVQRAVLGPIDADRDAGGGAADDRGDADAGGGGADAGGGGADAGGGGADADRTAAAAPVAVVPAGCWQAARTTGAYTLVGCTVAPGFDFADFAMLADDAAAHERLRYHCPELLPFV